MSVSSLEPATPGSRRPGRRGRPQSRASVLSTETGVTNGDTAAGSIADDDLPEFDDENELLGGDDTTVVEDDEDGEELFGDNMEA